MGIFIQTILACPSPNDSKVENPLNLHASLVDLWTTTISLNIVNLDSTEKLCKVRINRNDSTVFDLIEFFGDTTIIDSTVTPSRFYSYELFRVLDGELMDSSIIIDGTTLDTTSHDFSWQIDRIGLPGSFLNDITIVSSENIWAVGLILTDSLVGNAVHWDGVSWRVLQIVNSSELKSILFFDSDDIWVTTFGLPIHWDGEKWELFHIQNMGLNVSAGFSMWGYSSDEIYFCGYQGGIVQYDGDEFHKMASPTTIDLLCIDGILNNGDTAPSLVACGFNGSYSPGVLLHKTGPDDWRALIDQEVNPFGTESRNLFGSVAFVDAERFLVCVNWGVYLVSLNSTSYSYTAFLGSSGSHIYDLCVTSLRDFIIGGESGNLWHYNGLDWRRFTELADPNIVFNSVDIKEDNVAAVGVDYGLHGGSVIYRGHR